MITQETASAIWSTHREIQTTKELIAIIEEELAKPFNDKHSPILKDAFGQKRHFEMGIPSSPNSKTIYRVSTHAALLILRHHLADMQAALIKHSETARFELLTPPTIEDPNQLTLPDPPPTQSPTDQPQII